MIAVVVVLVVVLVVVVVDAHFGYSATMSMKCFQSVSERVTCKHCLAVLMMMMFGLRL